MITIVREYDLRPIDFATGRRAAISAEEMKTCDCCGRAIVRCADMSNGMTVGSECMYYLSSPVCRLGRRNRKADAILAALEPAGTLF